MTTGKRHFSSFEQTVIGAMSGVCEVLSTQPTVAVKNALQEGRPLSFTPQFMYRGVAVNALSIAPITAVQFGANRALAPFFADKNGNLTSGRKLATSGTAGMISGLVSGPAELVMIQQQRTGLSMGATLSNLVSQKGPTIIGKGLTLAGARDGLYMCFVLGTTPVLTQIFEEKLGSPGLAFTAGGLISGIGAAICTHPFDTMKTRVQGNALEPTQLSSVEVARNIYKEGGIGNFYKGFVPRGIRLVAAMFILNMSKTHFENTLEWYKTPTHECMSAS